MKNSGKQHLLARLQRELSLDGLEILDTRPGTVASTMADIAVQAKQLGERLAKFFHENSGLEGELKPLPDSDISEDEVFAAQGFLDHAGDILKSLLVSRSRPTRRGHLLYYEICVPFYLAKAMHRAQEICFRFHPSNEEAFDSMAVDTSPRQLPIDAQKLRELRERMDRAKLSGPGSVGPGSKSLSRSNIGRQWTVELDAHQSQRSQGGLRYPTVGPMPVSVRVSLPRHYNPEEEFTLVDVTLKVGNGWGQSDTIEMLPLETPGNKAWVTYQPQFSDLMPRLYLGIKMCLIPWPKHHL